MITLCAGMFPACGAKATEYKRTVTSVAEMEDYPFTGDSENGALRVIRVMAGVIYEITIEFTNLKWQNSLNKKF